MNSQHALVPLPQNYSELFTIFVTRNEFLQFEKRIDSQFINLSEKIDTLNNKVDERFNTLDNKVDDKFNTLDGRLVKLETKFDDFQKNSNTQFKWIITTMLSMIAVVIGFLTYFI